ncbi:glycosyltransferase [Candidatus Woesearchaeota archaeon]|nr:glycosyltransferase [Candidatus Woesearchaeota archaeon]
MHITSPQSSFGIAASLSCYRLGIPTVVSAHFGRRANPYASLAIKLKSLLPVMLAKHCSAVSDDARFLVKKDSQIIRPPVDIALFKIQNKDHFSYRDSDSPFILYPARINPSKGQADLFSAAHSLKNRGLKFQAAIAGHAADYSYLEKVKSMIGDYGLSDNVFVHEAIPYPDMPSAFASSDIIVFPTMEEFLGRIIIEASLCSVPNIAYASGGVREIISHNEDRHLSSARKHWGIGCFNRNALQFPRSCKISRPKSKG